MKIAVKTTEKERHFLYTLLCVVRTLVMIPMVIIGFAYSLIMWTLGTKDVVGKSVKYWNGMSFNSDD